MAKQKQTTYKCKECGLKAKSKGGLTYHISRKHKGNKSVNNCENDPYPTPVEIDPDMFVSDLKGLRNPGAYMTFVLWLALPSAYRPKITKTGADTQEKLAEELGVHRNVLSKWRARSGFQIDFRKVQLAWFEQDVGDIILAQRVEALKGSTQAAKLILETLGYLKKGDEDKSKVPEMLAEAVRNVSQFLK